MYDPVVNGQRLTFDVAGLYKGVMAFRDRQTGTVWGQLDGNAVQGPLDEERLAIVPVPMMTWVEWRAQHPDTLVLDLNTPYGQYYRPVQAGVGRLASESLVVGVEVNGAFTAFPVVILTNENEGSIVNAEVGGEPVVVLYHAGSGLGAAFSRTVGGQTLHFVSEAGTDGLQLVDDETGSTWDITGRAVDGPMAGASLSFVTSFISEWYGWVGYHPETELYVGYGDYLRNEE